MPVCEYAHSDFGATDAEVPHGSVFLPRDAKLMPAHTAISQK
jgi:hypothetical protein